MTIVHASDIKAFDRCPQEWHLSRRHPRKQLSRTAYGSVMHAAIAVLERTKDLNAALDTFKFYWHPANIDNICQPVDIWLPKDSYGSLAARGMETIRRYYDVFAYDDSELLAIEYEFVVPLDGTHDPDTGGPIMLGGTLDQLRLRKYRGKNTVSVEDLKTGKQPTYLRHHVQGTAYCYATTKKQFWTGNKLHHTEGFGQQRGLELWEMTRDYARQFWWINLNSFKRVNAGPRDEQDYGRLRLAVQAVTESINHNIFPLSLSGEPCEFCSFRDVCGEGTP